MGQPVPVDDLPQRGSRAVPEDDLPTQFQSTPGGAAVGNPVMARYGDKVLKEGPSNTDALAAIGGAGGIGGVMGYFSKELLGGAGNVIGSFPQPAARSVGGFLKGASQLIGAGGRAAPAAAGAISGLTSETAGQAAEAAGAGPVTAEVARIAGGAISPIPDAMVMEVLQKYVKTPALSLMSKFKKETALSILEKFDKAPNSLTDTERKFIEGEVASLRGGPKSDQPLESVGSVMGAEGQRLFNEAEWRALSAEFNRGGVNAPGQGRQMADVGGELQGSINTRYKGALDARRAEYAKNEEARDAIVSQREKAGQFVNTLPEYQKVVAELKSQLTGNRAPSVQASYQKILDELSEDGKSITFQRIDDVRRKLGDAFRGKPAEGYDAIGEQAAKDLYGKVSEIQKRYAGFPQAKLLDDYAEKTEGLNIFSSKYGKKATALDQYREDTFASDPSTLPSAYFKTRGSVQALKELTGNQQQVNAAALEFANRELAGKDAAAARKWLGANSEWLAETRPAQALLNVYVNRLEGAERSLRNAADFAAQAAKDTAMLTRQSLPAQRAVDLIKSGDTELWGKVVPAIVQSPQAKAEMVKAVRQVVADQATAKSTGDLFNRNIRGFLEQSNIASKAEMDFIAQKLASIQAMNVPEAEKLGIAKRIILQATGGWAASAASRGGVNAYQWTKEKMVPD